jgi:hypothetical protein
MDGFLTEGLPNPLATTHIPKAITQTAELGAGDRLIGVLRSAMRGSMHRFAIL